MEKLISNRFYFDYNATSPLSDKVTDFLRSGDLPFGNPASLHQTGKKTKRFVNETSDFLFQTFKLNPQDFSLVFHSGATEGINSFFKSHAFTHFKNKEKVSFYFSTLDHACVMELKEDLQALGHDVYFFSPDKNADLNVSELIKEIQADKNTNKYLNYTFMNNETGVIWPLENAEKIKKETGVIIHVDAVQIVGKMKGWDYLNSNLDAYSFSAHKFGALKGVGFSFLKKTLKTNALIKGGQQQQGLRAGTENALGIYSIKLALIDLLERFNPEALELTKNFIESALSVHYGDKITIVSKEGQHRNLNTIFIVCHGQKAETLSAKFDLMGVELSTGSACSSGIIKENRILVNLGFAHEDSRSSLRFSFSPFMTLEEGKTFLEKIIKILG